MRRLLPVATLLAGLLPAHAFAHAIAGDRVFPATFTIDDPAVNDELTLPQVQIFDEPQDGGGNAWTTRTSAEFDKRITENFGLSVSDDWVDRRAANGNGRANGFDSLGVGAKYVLLTNAEHEFIASVGLDTDIGGTGAQRVGVESYTTFTPNVYFGKGFGDLPDSLTWLKPLAVTGQFGVGLPVSDADPDTYNYGFSVQYSLLYLQQHVKDVGLTAPFNKLIPLVEFNLSQPFDKDAPKTVTGTIAPGVIWVGTASQVGLEALIPVNGESGHGVGAIAQLHFFLDDLFPASIGRPLWE